MWNTYLDLEFLENVPNVETRPCILERLFLDKVDLVVQFVQLFQELSLCHRRLQNMSDNEAHKTHTHSPSSTLRASAVVLDDQFTSPCPWTSNLKFLSLSLDHKVLENFQGLRIPQTVRYVWSCDVYKFCYRHRARKYGEECLTYWCQILLTDICQ